MAEALRAPHKRLLVGVVNYLGNDEHREQTRAMAPPSVLSIGPPSRERERLAKHSTVCRAL